MDTHNPLIIPQVMVGMLPIESRIMGLIMNHHRERGRDSQALQVEMK
jgi:hypothetical protein